eukprot:jgi/Botrbrau1/8574/Bobra.0359s0037.1
MDMHNETRNTPAGAMPNVRTLPTGDTLKRERSQSAADLLNKDAKEGLSAPLLPFHFHEPMAQYLPRLRDYINESYRGIFSVSSNMVEDGLYLHKRPVRVMGEALGQAAVLEQAGTVFHHVTLYVKAGEKITGLDYGPEGNVDMNSNWMEAVPCGQVVLENPDLPTQDGNLSLLHIKSPHHGLNHESVKQAIAFMEGRKYHAILNNCMQNSDFLLRVLTGGLVKDAPLVYDVLCGQVPERDSPLLLMFLLMTKMSWFQVCDGATQMAAFLQQHTSPPPLEDLASEFSGQQTHASSARSPSGKCARRAADSPDDLSGGTRKEGTGSLETEPRPDLTAQQECVGEPIEKPCTVAAAG